MARERRTGRRRGRAPRVVLVAAVVLVLVAAILAFTPVFALREVRIEGANTVTPDEVTAAARPPQGRPLLLVSERDIAERVAALPPVAEVRVRRVLPDRVAITITERQPAFVLDRAGPLALVDATGFAYAAVGQPPAGLVRAQAPADPATLRAIAAVLAVTGDLRVDHVEAHSSDSITLFLPEDRRVIMGSGEQAEQKVAVARTLLDSTDATFIDVTAPDHPSTR